MTALKLSQMDAATALDGTELVGLVQDGGNVQSTVGDIVGLAAGSSSSSGFGALFTLASGMTVDSGITRVRLSGYSTGGIGGADYIYDATVDAAFVIANPRTAFLAADSRGFRLDPHQYLTVEMFGAKADYAGNPATCTDSYAALMAALQFHPDTTRAFTPIIHAGVGSYYSSTYLEPRGPFHLMGSGSGRFSGGVVGSVPTRIMFPTDSYQIIIPMSLTLGDGEATAPYPSSSGGSVVEGVSLECITMGTTLTKHGVWLRATATLRDVCVVAAAGDGIHIFGQGQGYGGAGALLGDCNEWQIHDCYVHSAGGNGIYVNGSDANGGSCTNTTIHEAGLCGVFESAYILNHYAGLQITGYGNQGVTHDTWRWQLISGNGTEEPGTGSQWYKLYNVGGASGGPFPLWTGAVQPGFKMPIYCGNGSTFFGCYVEGGATLAHAPQAVIVGGNVGHTQYTGSIGATSSGDLVSNTGMGHYRSTGGLGSASPLYVNIGDYEETIVGAPDPYASGPFDCRTIFRHSIKGQNPLIWHWSGNDQFLRRVNEKPIWKITGPATAETFGRSTAQPNIFVAWDGFVVSNQNGAGRIWDSDTTVPTTGYHQAGEIRWKHGPTGAGDILWVCTVAGTPGTWVAVGVYARSDPAIGIGYTTGAGGAITQITSRTTGVTLNTVCGAITLVSAAGSAAWQTLTVTNSTVVETDTIDVVQKSGTDKYMIHVTAVGAGSFDITFATTGGTTTEQPVFNFAVGKAVAA